MAARPRRLARLLATPSEPLPDRARSTTRPSVFEYYPNLRRARRYVLENLSSKITLSEVASVAGLERKYFSTFFRRRVGICFRDWLAMVRVARAAILIREEDYSLGMISDLVGFGDRRTFQRAFKKWVGVTPSEFRKRVQPAPEWVAFAKLLPGRDDL